MISLYNPRGGVTPGYLSYKRDEQSSHNLYRNINDSNIPNSQEGRTTYSLPSEWCSYILEHYPSIKGGGGYGALMSTALSGNKCPEHCAPCQM